MGLAGRQLISKLLYERSMDVFDEKGISVSLFESKAEKEALQAIKEHKLKHGTLPEIPDFIENYGKTFELVPIEEMPAQPISWFCEKFLDAKKFNEICDMLEKIQPMIEDGSAVKTEEALAEVRKFVMHVDSNLIEHSYARLKEDARKRLDKHWKIKNEGIKEGITTGFDAMDYITNGIMPADFWTILGFTGVGKSFFLCLMAAAAAKAGKKVLIVTREMSPEQLMLRMDALYCSISPSKLRVAEMTDEEEERYEKYVNEVSDYIVIEQSTGGVSQIMSFQQKHGTEITFVDGPYLMIEDSSSTSGWEKINEVWIGLRNIALSSGIPIVATMQLKETKANLSNISMAKAIAQQCTSIWGIEQLEEQEKEKEITVRSLKQRDAEKDGAFAVSWDFDSMDLDIISANIKGYSEWIAGKKAEEMKTISRKVGERREEEPVKKKLGKGKLSIKK